MRRSAACWGKTTSRLATTLASASSESREEKVFNPTHSNSFKISQWWM